MLAKANPTDPDELARLKKWWNELNIKLALRDASNIILVILS
jgi:hypothetical protein